MIGKIDLEAGRTYGWLSNLANKTGKEFVFFVNENGTAQVHLFFSFPEEKNYLTLKFSDRGWS